MYTGASGNGRVVILPKIANTYCCYAIVDPSFLLNTATGAIAAGV